jgi:hypothetical protein
VHPKPETRKKPEKNLKKNSKPKRNTKKPKSNKKKPERNKFTKPDGYPKLDGFGCQNLPTGSGSGVKFNQKT